MKSEMSGEKTVMVGGAAMFPSKNIIQNAVNSKDHTTLVAAVKAAGLVGTLEGKGPFTVFAPTNAAFGKLPAGTVDTLVKPENKATLTKILTYHVVAGKLEASDLTDGKKLKTVQGEELTVKRSRQYGDDHRRQGRFLDRHDPERQPVERRDPRGRYRPDAVVTPPPVLLLSPTGCATASRGNPARFFVTAIACAHRFYRAYGSNEAGFPAYNRTYRPSEMEKPGIRHVQPCSQR